jgi:hypothetical protein
MTQFGDVVHDVISRSLALKEEVASEIVKETMALFPELNK